MSYRHNFLVFSLSVPCYSLGKHTFWIFVSDSKQYAKRMIHKKCSKVSIILALDGSISSFFIAANSILQQNLW